MKKKPLGKLFLSLLLAIIIVSLGTVTAFAETAVTGTNMSFDKYLVMDGGASTPAATFNFTIATGAAKSADPAQNTPQIYAGNDAARVTGMPSIAANQAVFAATDTASTAIASGDVITLNGTAYSSGNLPDSKKYVSKPVTVDFTGVTYKEPGIYRYVITETAADTSLSGIITNDPVTTRILDVYVTSNGTALSVANYVLHRSADDIQINAGGEYGTTKKDTGFTNVYATTGLTLKKTVSGNQAYRQQYFKFNVVINGAAGAKYTVDLTGATSTAISIKDSTYTNPGTLTADAAGKVEVTYYLKHNEQIVIQGLPKNATYSVVEDLSDDEGYTVTATKDTENLALTNKGTGTQTMDGTDDAIVYNNYRNGTVPTGILLDIAPYALMVTLAGTAMLILVMKKRRSHDSQGF